MTASPEEFRELLDNCSAESFKLLRELSVYGIPEEMRGEVWLALLRITDDSFSATSDLSGYSGRHELDEDIRSDCLRVLNTACESLGWEDNQRAIAETILLIFMEQHPEMPFHEHIVYMLIPFVSCIPDETRCLQAFIEFSTRFLDVLQQYEDNETVNQFMNLFRLRQPDLYRHFENDEEHVFPILQKWIMFLLSEELSLPNVLRLWDSYFADDKPNLHLCVCLAILDDRKQSFFECSYDNLVSELKSLKQIDIDRILVLAYALADELSERESEKE